MLINNINFILNNSQPYKNFETNKVIFVFHESINSDNKKVYSFLEKMPLTYSWRAGNILEKDLKKQYKIYDFKPFTEKIPLTAEDIDNRVLLNKTLYVLHIISGNRYKIQFWNEVAVYFDKAENFVKYKDLAKDSWYFIDKEPCFKTKDFKL